MIDNRPHLSPPSHPLFPFEFNVPAAVWSIGLFSLSNNTVYTALSLVVHYNTNTQCINILFLSRNLVPYSPLLLLLEAVEASGDLLSTNIVVGYCVSIHFPVPPFYYIIINYKGVCVVCLKTNERETYRVIM